MKKQILPERNYTMLLSEAFNVIDKNLTEINKGLGFKKVTEAEDALLYTGEQGNYKIRYDKESDVLAFEVAYDGAPETAEYSTISKTLFELEQADEREARSASNEMLDEVERLFKVNKKVDLDKVKMPKSVSRSKAKRGTVNYDVDSLANRFGTIYPDLKDEIKRNVLAYGEFLPETFFMEHGNARVLEVIKNGSEAERKKLFKMLGEVFEDGTNEVQDIIAVTILGEMKNDPELMAVADRYMTEYMAGPVHEVNKITARENRYTKKLANPPAYKPKKKKSFSVANAINEANRQ